jgi:hypothetical protein
VTTDDLFSRIRERQASFAKLPFFSFLRDATRTPQERLVFTPAAAPFIMAFGDFNKHILYRETASDPLQQVINVHSKEDESHYQLYLRDLDTLGYDVPVRFADTLQFLWAPERTHSRLTCYELAGMLAPLSLPLRLIVIESIESAGAAAFVVFSQLAEEYTAGTGQQLMFFGHHHKELETGHTIGADDVEERLRSVMLNANELELGARLIDRVFVLFTSMMEELHRYALENQGGVPSGKLPPLIVESMPPR